MKSFKITDDIMAVCEWQKTRTAFRHIATLLHRGTELDKVKICYLNRTWEAYEFESVLNKLMGHALDAKLLEPDELAAFQTAIKNGGERERSGLATIGMVAAMGELLGGDTKAQRNDWKARMLKAGLEGRGLIMPDDWDELSEDDKEARLNAVINELTSEKPRE